MKVLLFKLITDQELLLEAKSGSRTVRRRTFRRGTFRRTTFSPWDISPYFSPCADFAVNISLEFLEVSLTFDSQSNLVADCGNQLSSSDPNLYFFARVQF